MNIFLGFDPGIRGGCAAMDDKHNFVEAFPMPLIGKAVDIQEIAEWMRDLRMDNPIRLAACEKVRSMPKQGVTSVCTFCRNYGVLLGILGTLRIPVIEITPQTWKKKILAGTKKDKDAAIEYVRKRYPDVNLIPGKTRKPHDGVADAVCIAEYCYRKD